MKRNYWKFVCCLVPACCFLSGCQKSEPGYYQGYVEGEFVYVSTSVSGNLETLKIQKGQTVVAGTSLVQLDPNPQVLQIQEMTHRIAQAQAKMADLSKGRRPSELAAIEARWKTAQTALDQSKRDLERRQELFAAGNTDAIAEEELDRFKTDVAIKESDVRSIEAELETATLGGRSDAIAAAQDDVGALNASLEQLNWQLNEKEIKAPTGGFIQDTLYRVGEFVPAGRPVVSLLPPENIKIRFFVPQAVLPSIQMNDSIQVYLDGMDSRIPAKISYISSESEFTPPVIYSKESRGKLVFMIEAVPESGGHGDLRPGQPLEVYLN